MNALLLRLAAPMQAWGTQSRFSERDTQLEPSKSGVVGLLAAALGRPRDADLTELSGLVMGVRVDREGRKLRDYHTVGGGELPPGELAHYPGVRSYGVSRANQNGTEVAVTRRHYLADARFLVALGSPDRRFLEGIAEALRRPVHPLFLGRKAFVPAEPILPEDPGAIREGDVEQVLVEEPWVPSFHDLRFDPRKGGRVPRTDRLRLVLESPAADGAATRLDSPVSFVRTDRIFAERSVITKFTDKPITRWIDSQMAKKEDVA